MGTFEIKNQTTDTQYEYRNENIIVQGGYIKDAETDELKSVNGSCYRPTASEEEIGEDIGNFNGYMRDGQIKYDMSEVTRQDSELVWIAITEIEQNIISNEND